MTVNLPPACGGCVCTWLVLHYITLEFCIWLFELFEYSLLNQSDIICSHDIILYVNESLTDVLYLQKDNCPIKKTKTSLHYKHNTDYNLDILIKLSKY